MDAKQLVTELKKRREQAEDFYDLLAFRTRASEPSRPFEEFMLDLPQKL